MTTETSSAPEAPSTFDSVADAVAELDRRESARSEQRAAEKAAKAEQQAQVSAEVEEQASDQPLPETEEETGDPPQPEDEGSDESQDVEPDEEAPDEPKETSVVTLDGKEIEIPKGTPRALVEGIKKLESDFRADYTRKTQEVAVERQQVEAAKQQTSQAITQLQQAQATLAQFYQAAIGEPPPIELAQTDPQAFLIQREMHARKVQQFQELMQHGQGLSQQTMQQAEQARAQYLQEQAAKLKAAIPEIAEPAKREDFIKRIAPAAQKYGVSESDLRTIGDHRVILMLRDLAKLQSREQAAGTVKQKLANVPPKVNKPGTASQDGGKGQKAAQAKQQFMRSGRSLRDVARYLRETE